MTKMLVGGGVVLAVVVAGAYFWSGSSSSPETLKDADIEMTAGQFIDAADDTSASERFEKRTMGLVDLETRFEHVVPNQYSEIYTRVSGVAPGTRIIGHLSGGDAAIEDAVVTGTAGDDGVVLLTWRITSYGTYDIIVNDTENKVFEEDSVRVY